MTFNCELCNKEFKYKSKYLEHKNKKIPCNKLKEELNCKICNLIFDCFYNKNKHDKTSRHIKNVIRQKNINEINNQLLEINEYIYIATNKIQDKLNIYKIGRTNNLQSRLVNYNTGQIEPYYYLAHYKCTHAPSIEKRIFMLLANFKVKK